MNDAASASSAPLHLRPDSSDPRRLYICHCFLLPAAGERVQFTAHTEVTSLQVIFQQQRKEIVASCVTSSCWGRYNNKQIVFCCVRVSHRMSLTQHNPFPLNGLHSSFCHLCLVWPLTCFAVGLGGRGCDSPTNRHVSAVTGEA